MSSLDIVTADVPYQDDCPVLTRIKTFVLELGTSPTIEHIVRDRKGDPVDLSDYFPDEESQSSEVASGKILVRSKEIIAPAGANNPVVETIGTVFDAANGVIRFPSNAIMFKHAGIYQLSVGVFDGDDKLLKSDQPIVWVEPSLFTNDKSDRSYICGPPTLQQVRNELMDSGPGDNLLLQSVEFTDDQIAQAVCKPVRHWNEVPPPLRPPQDTRNFPFQEHWLKGISAQLLIMAAHNYRRNHLDYDAGGVSVADKNKEQSYLRAGQIMWDEYTLWVTHQKVVINTSLFGGSIGSPYSGHFN